MKILFNFSPLRYLAQNFPVLANPKADRHSDLDRRDAIYRWPSDHPAWEVAEAERHQVRQLGQSRPPAAGLAEDRTVADAVEMLNGWFIAEARRLLPESVVRLLARWLGEQWSHFSTDPLPEDYLWSYLSLLGDGAVDRPGGRYTIPPFVGRIEVAAYTIWDGGEDGPQRDWLNGGRFVHLCDRLDEVFCEVRGLEGEDGDWVRGDDGRPKKTRRVLQEGFLWIDYKSIGMTRDWVERRNNFPYWPGAMQATEHWILRMKEVDQPRTERTVSRTFREPLAHSISSKLPRVWQTIQHAARTIDNARCRLLAPIWSDEAFLLGALEWASDKARGYYLHGEGRRLSNIAYTSFRSDDNPRNERMGEAIRWLRARSTAGRNRPDPSVYEGSFSDWEEADLFVADLAEVKRQQIWEEQQVLFELHRGICESLETAIRRRFVEDGFTPQDKRFAFAFREWVASRLGIAGIEAWDGKIHRGAFNPVLGRGRVGNLTVTLPKLDQVIENIISGSGVLDAIDGSKSLGSTLSCLLSVEVFDNGSNLTEWRSVVDCLGPTGQLSDLLLAAKILIEIRNKLIHGTIDDDQPRDEEVVVLNHEEGFCVRLTQLSLEYCYRLIIPLLNAFHGEAVLEEKSVWWAACDWLEDYARGTPGVEVDKVPGDETGFSERGFTARLSFTAGVAARLNSENNRGAPACPELRVRAVRSRFGFDINGYADYHLGRGTQELIILFVQERECFWLERLPGPRTRFDDLPGSDGKRPLSGDGILRSRCFPGLWLDKKAFFECNQSRLDMVLSHGLDSPQHIAIVERIQ